MSQGRRSAASLTILVGLAASSWACGSSSAPGATGTDGGADVTTDQGQTPESGADTAAPQDGGGADAATPDAPFVPAAHPAWPQVPNTQGRTLTAPALVTVTASNDVPTDGTDTVASLDAFSDAVPGSAMWAAVSAEYQLGALTSAIHLTGPAMAAGTYTTAQLQAYVSGVLAVDGGSIAPPNGNTIYLLFLPAGATLSGRTDCGYHTAFPSSTTSTGDQLANVIRCPPVRDQETELGQLTRVASHEIVESATDPLGRGYHLPSVTTEPYDASIWNAWDPGSKSIELGDLCEGTRTFEAFDGGPDGGWEYQRMWSNAAAAKGGDPCVPPASVPYESVSAPQGWYAVPAGGSVDIPLTGWSAEITTTWLVHTGLSATKDGGAFGGILDAGVTLVTEAGVGTTSPCYVREAMNNGVGGVLHVTAPAGATSGDFAIFSVTSFREKPPPSCYPPITEDNVHFWPVGVYVQ
ncbi:MAG TPA: hypothetical protein VF765_11205 [Polyangiaceae bacterium]